MVKNIVFAAALFFTALSLAFGYDAEIFKVQQGWLKPLEPIEKSDRVLVLAPHPDDETIGCAGVIQQALKAGANVHVAYLTNGDHNQLAFIVYEKRITIRSGEFIHMGEVRKQEAIAAMNLLGLNKNNLVFLGYPDFGTFTIFRDYWQTKNRYQSFLTRASSVPYKNDLSFGAPYIGESILADLKTVLKQYKPNKIFVSHPADTNVDHKALYLFLQVALADLEDSLSRPKVYPYLIHCVGWPLPRHYHPELPLAPPPQFFYSSTKWFKYDLTKNELENKYSAILCYPSQTQSSAFYLLAFARKNELFGIVPDTQLVMPYVNMAINAQETMSVKDRIGAILALDDMFTERTVDMTGVSDQADSEPGKVSYSLEDTMFVIKIKKAKENARRASASVDLFGYSYKIPFARMPKIRIITKNKSFIAFDSRKVIERSAIRLEMASEQLIIKVPLKVMKDPDFILASVKAYTGAGVAEATGFRKINIRRK